LDSTPFFDLHATHNPHRWFLPVSRGLCAGHGETVFLFGGVALAAAVSALEKTFSRSVVWATAQYVSYAEPGSVLDLDVWTAASGRFTTQARVTGHVGDREILTVNAALGDRPGAEFQQWVTAPAVPPPEACRAVVDPGDVPDGVHSRMEIRIASGRFYSDPPSTPRTEDGRLVCWIRPMAKYEPTLGTLALVGDYLTTGVTNALGRPLRISSLDNTMRFLSQDFSDWLLCDIRIEGAARGFAHGTMYIFSQTGRLLAAGSQSTVVREGRPG
jgi:acyl-CoA thioesterase